MSRMVQPRDYQQFLRASATPQAGQRAVGMRGLATLLPAPPPAATLWSRGALLLASAVLPAILWWLGKLDPLDVVLLYMAEGTTYWLMVVARIVFTAADPLGNERPRVVTALAYFLWCGVTWGGLMFAALACVSPRASGVAVLDWVQALPAHFTAPAMAATAAMTAVCLGLDVLRRSDYIDAYLELGPRETARYGYVYPMALAFLLGSALVLRVILQGAGLDATAGLVPAVFLALWLIGWRTVLQLTNLTLPLWGRSLARLEDGVEHALEKHQHKDAD